MRKLVPLLFTLLLAGCPRTGDNTPQKPQIAFDRAQLAFGVLGCNATSCQSFEQTLIIINNGLEDLVVSKVEVTDDGGGVFKLTDVSGKDASGKTTVKSKQQQFAKFTYSPTAPGDSTGSVKITSNAENQPVATLAITGKAVLK